MWPSVVVGESELPTPTIARKLFFLLYNARKLLFLIKKFLTIHWFAKEITQNQAISRINFMVYYVDMIRYIWYTIYDMIPYDIWYDIIYMIWCMVWYGMVYDMIRYDTIRYIWWYMIWYDMIYVIWYDMVGYGMCYDMICDMIWYDMISYDMIRYDIW
jgi:hypothetical protein